MLRPNPIQLDCQTPLGSAVRPADESNGTAAKVECMNLVPHLNLIQSIDSPSAEFVSFLEDGRYLLRPPEVEATGALQACA